MNRGEPKPKACNYTRIAEHDDPEGVLPLVRELVRAHHHHLIEARIGAAWRRGLKRDKDNLLVLGKCVNASDLHKEFNDLDFVIVLNGEAWKTLDAKQRRALVDHELCHASVRKDKHGETVLDERGDPVYRVRKHDIEQRHGLYKSDLRAFVETAMGKEPDAGPSLLDGIEGEPEQPAPPPVEPDAGKASRKRGGR